MQYTQNRIFIKRYKVVYSLELLRDLKRKEIEKYPAEANWHWQWMPESLNFIYRHGKGCGVVNKVSRPIDCRLNVPPSKTIVSNLSSPYSRRHRFFSLFFSTVERVLERPHDDNRELRWLTLHCDFNRGFPSPFYEPSIRFTSLGTEIRHLQLVRHSFLHFYFVFCDQKYNWFRKKNLSSIRILFLLTN